MVCLARAIERFVVLRRHESMSVLEVSGLLLRFTVAVYCCCALAEQ